MTDRPIIFSAPMILALLDGRKTMTRRVPRHSLSLWRPGDRLWVREAMHDKDRLRYAADGALIDCTLAPDDFQTTRQSTMPGIFMPRWASRLTLVLTAKKYERLQMKGNADILAEGIPGDPFAALWDSLHGAGAWASNPEVVALSFTVHHCNVDKMPHDPVRKPKRA